MSRSRAIDPPSLSVVVPVYNEGESVVPVLRSLDSAIAVPHEILVVYDFDEDPTVAVIDRLAAELPAVRGLRNDLGRGVLNAMKAGIDASAGAALFTSLSKKHHTSRPWRCQSRMSRAQEASVSSL